MSLGLGGFQETEQLPIFSKITKYQGHVNNPKRMAEIAARCFDRAMLEMGPTQLNIPRDFFYGEIEATISPPIADRPRAGRLARRSMPPPQRSPAAKFPVILAGGGVIMSGAPPRRSRSRSCWMRRCATATCTTIRSPPRIASAVGPLGYQGSKAAMKLIAQADVVLALGTRLGPFGTLPQHGLDYWPKQAKIIQIDADPRMLGSGQTDLGGHPWRCARRRRRALERLKDRLARRRGQSRGAGRTDPLREACLGDELEGWTHERDAYSIEVARDSSYMHPRQVLRELEKAMPANAMVSTDIGNICSVANSYLRFEAPRSMFAAMSFGNCGYAFPVICGAKMASPDRPAFAYVGDGAWGISFNELLTCARQKIGVTVVVFNNGQWGAEKKNHVDFYSRRYQGVNLENPSWAGVARAFGCEGVTVDRLADVGPALQGGGAGAERGPHHGARDDGDEGIGRSVPPRRAVEAGAISRQVQGVRMSRGCGRRQSLHCRRRESMRLLVFNAGSSSLKFDLLELPTSGPARRLAAGAFVDAADGSGRFVLRAAAALEGSAPAVLDARRGSRVRTEMAREPLDPRSRFVGRRHGDRASNRARRRAVPRHRRAERTGARGARRAWLARAAAHPPCVAVIATVRRRLGAGSADHRRFRHGLLRRICPKRRSAMRCRRAGAPTSVSAAMDSTAWRTVILCESARAHLRTSRAAARIVSLQLGRGCSVTATLGGQAIATSMGFTPLEGLVMGTRSGDVDPGAILHVMERSGMSPAEMRRELNEQSGLLGLSGRTADMGELLALEQEGDPAAALAVEVFCRRARHYVAAYMAELGGADAIVFGGGIGENCPDVRRRILGSLEWAGIQLQPEANGACVGVVVEHRRRDKPDRRTGHSRGRGQRHRGRCRCRCLRRQGITP